MKILEKQVEVFGISQEKITLKYQDKFIEIPISPERAQPLGKYIGKKLSLDLKYRSQEAVQVDPIPAPVDPVPAPIDPIPTPVDPIPAPVDPIPAPVDPIPAGLIPGLQVNPPLPQDGYSGVTGKHYFVSTLGDNSNEGTKESPWRTPGHASRQLNPGDCLTISPGVYQIVDDWEDILRPTSGTENAWVTIKGYGATLEGRQNVRSAVILQGTKYLRMEGLEIRSSSEGGAQLRDGIQAMEGGRCERVTLFNMHIHRLNTFGVNAMDIDYLTVWNCNIEYCGYGAIGGPKGQTGFRHTAIKYSLLSFSGRYENGITYESRSARRNASYDRPDGFGIEPSAGPIDIDYCLVEGNFGDGLDSKAANTSINNCVLRNNFGDQAKLWRGDSGIHNTLIYGRGGDVRDPTPWSSIVLEGEDGDKFAITNCTIDDDIGGNYSMYAQYNEAKNISIKLIDNIFMMTGNRGTTWFNRSVDLTASYNTFYVPGHEYALEHGDNYYNGQSLRALGEGNEYASANFVRRGNGLNVGDYSLQPSSPGQGTASDGNDRGSVWKG